jgi:hypothetical protein
MQVSHQRRILKNPILDDLTPATRISTQQIDGIRAIPEGHQCYSPIQESRQRAIDRDNEALHDESQLRKNCEFDRVMRIQEIFEVGRLKETHDLDIEIISVDAFQR